MSKYLLAKAICRRCYGTGEIVIWGNKVVSWPCPDYTLDASWFPAACAVAPSDDALLKLDTDNAVMLRENPTLRENLKRRMTELRGDAA